MACAELAVETKGNVAILTLNRPEKLNALNRAMARELPLAVQEINADDDLRVAILTGTGRGFCSGADVTTFGSQPEPRTRRERLAAMGRAYMSIAQLEKPTICAVNGVAAGGGFSLTLMCDIRIASDRARFVAAWVQRGLCADFGATLLLPIILGSSRALQMMYTGEPVEANEAERIGLVSEVVPHDDLMNRALGLAERIAKGAPIALETTKRAVYRNILPRLVDQFEYESYCQMQCNQSEDHEEGTRAFVQKRQPVFKGR